jgi:hypothetical protein
MSSDSATPATKRRGCCGTGCLILILLLLLVAALGAALYFQVPQKLGLIKSPAERLLSDSPDRETASALMEELAAAGFDLDGVEAYVLPLRDGTGSLAYVVLDASEGFAFPTNLDDPITDSLEQLAMGNVATEFDIHRVGMEYKSITGESLLTLTASTQTISDYANGRLSREEFLKGIDGEVNWVAFYTEVLQ